MLSFVADSLKAGDFQSNLRVAALTFSKRSVVEFLLNTHVSKPDPKQEVLNNIAELVYTKGVTNTSGALRVASETLFQERNGDRDAVQNLAVIITDGNSNVDRDPIQDANKLKVDGVYIVGILIGTDKSINQEEMEAIVSNKDELIRLKKYEDLIPFRETIVRRMCTRTSPLVVSNYSYCLNICFVMFSFKQISVWLTAFFSPRKFLPFDLSILL